MATQKVLRTTFPYAFGLVEPTGASIPEVTMFTIAQAPFTIGDLDVLPIPLLHGGMPVLGFRFGNVAYCTDTNSIPASSMELLGGLDTLVIDGLRWQGHPTHFTVSEAIQVADVLRPRRTLLTHIAHQVRHAEASQALPDGVELAYDGLVFSS
jgi:phosphoribosyl 1,2-cyclic phosphate phosphodiesterase